MKTPTYTKLHRPVETGLLDVDDEGLFGVQRLVKLNSLGLFIRGHPEGVLGLFEAPGHCRVGNGHPPPMFVL